MRFLNLHDNLPYPLLKLVVSFQLLASAIISSCVNSWLFPNLLVSIVNPQNVVSYQSTSNDCQHFSGTYVKIQIIHLNLYFLVVCLVCVALKAKLITWFYWSDSRNNLVFEISKTVLLHVHLSSSWFFLTHVRKQYSTCSFAWDCWILFEAAMFFVTRLNDVLIIPYILYCWEF